MREQSIRDVVFIFPGALGDLLLALPTLRAIRACHPAAHVTAVVNEPLRALAHLAGVADATAGLEAAEAAWLFGGERMPEWLRQRPVVYSWFGARDPDLQTRLEAVSTCVRCFGVERGDARLHAARAYARAAGVPDTPRAVAAGGRIVAPPSARVEAFWETLTGPVLVVHPGAGAVAKRWTPTGFAGVAAWWRRRQGGSVVGLFGPADVDLVGRLGCSSVRDWGLPDVAAVLARAVLFVGNDSGVSHLAAAVGTVGVAVFGPTEPRRWRPPGPHLIPVRARGSDAGGITLDALPVARVLAACRRQLTLTSRNRAISVQPAVDRQ